MSFDDALFCCLLSVLIDCAAALSCVNCTLYLLHPADATVRPLIARHIVGTCTLKGRKFYWRGILPVTLVLRFETVSKPSS